MESIRLNELESITKDLNNSASVPLHQKPIIPPTLPTSESSIALEANKPQNLGIYEQINQLLDGQDQQQKTILEAREILGDSANNLSDEQVYDLVNEIQFLVDSWLEEYERKVFDGKSLDELLQLDKV